MAVLTNAVNRHTKVSCVGICHGTHFRQDTIAKAYGVARQDVSLNVVGLITSASSIACGFAGAR